MSVIYTMDADTLYTRSILRALDGPDTRISVEREDYQQNHILSSYSMKDFT